MFSDYRVITDDLLTHHPNWIDSSAFAIMGGPQWDLAELKQDPAVTFRDVMLGFMF